MAGDVVPISHVTYVNDPVTLLLLLYLLKELDVVLLHRRAMRFSDNKDCVFLRHIISICFG